VTAPVLALRDVTKSYQDGGQRRSILTGLGLELRAGEVLAVVGPSGSGKSTLLNLVAGTLVADAGEVLLTTPRGRFDLCALDDGGRAALRRREIGYVFQFFNLVPTLTVRENVLLPLELNGLMHLAERSLERVASLGLTSRLDAFPDVLSGGERQRAAIARALVHEPPLVLADEPTGNLDRHRADQVAELLWQEVRDAGAALLVATHDASVAARADQVLELAA